MGVSHNYLSHETAVIRSDLRGNRVRVTYAGRKRFQYYRAVQQTTPDIYLLHWCYDQHTVACRSFGNIYTTVGTESLLEIHAHRDGAPRSNLLGYLSGDIIVSRKSAESSMASPPLVQERTTEKLFKVKNTNIRTHFSLARTLSRSLSCSMTTLTSGSLTFSTSYPSRNLMSSSKKTHRLMTCMTIENGVAVTTKLKPLLDWCYLIVISNKASMHNRPKGYVILSFMYSKRHLF